MKCYAEKLLLLNKRQIPFTPNELHQRCFGYNMCVRIFDSLKYCNLLEHHLEEFLGWRTNAQRCSWKFAPLRQLGDIFTSIFLNLQISSQLVFGKY